MKTTVDIADPLLKQAKRLAAKRGVTLKAVLESALRRELASEQAGPRPPIRTHVFTGEGLQEGYEWGDWEAFRAAAYEGRGG